VSIELFLIVIEHEERLWLTSDHEREISIFADNREFARQKRHPVPPGSRNELIVDMVANHLGRREDSAAQLRDWVVAERQGVESASGKERIDLADGTSDRGGHLRVERQVPLVMGPGLIATCRHTGRPPMRFTLVRPDCRVTPTRRAAMRELCLLIGHCCFEPPSALDDFALR